MSAEDEGFIRRWSARKRAAAQTATAGPSPAEGASEAEGVARDGGATSPDEVAADPEELDAAALAELPSIDAITLQTDLAPFLRRGVPALLKNAALRRMWLIDPAIRDHADLAVDYAWDWNAPGGLPGGGGAVSQGGVERFLRGLERHDAGGDAAPPPETDAAEGREPGASGEGEPPKALASAPAEGAEPAVPPAPRRSDGPCGDRAEPTPAPLRRHGGARPV